MSPDSGTVPPKHVCARRHIFEVACAMALCLSAGASGCVSPSGYFSDRWCDAKDIFTASVGTGGGAKARVGPLNAGLFFGSDITGLRGGEFFYLPGDFHERSGWFTDCDGVLLLVYSIDGFVLNRDRHKDYQSLIMPPNIDLPSEPHYYTQLEVAAGLGGTLRLGFNPGELLDFALGWFGIDIYGDDREAEREREEAEKKAKEWEMLQERIRERDKTEELRRRDYSR